MGHVLVTGATGGIGTALVGALTAAGHQVTAVGRDVGRLGVRGIEADLADPETLAGAGEWGEVQALVHCAGISPVEAVADAGPETWRRTMAVNVASAAELVRLTLPALRRSRGHVIFVNASAGLTGVPRWSAFVASKAALRELAIPCARRRPPTGSASPPSIPGRPRRICWARSGVPSGVRTIPRRASGRRRWPR
ncbi:SDR family NAD(P)-dependent oxidoreductase [Nonomuraea terrae]|uniref:SDR family NAD(P)-dependent oxidoreductase n=1 Tax=Nonomuraea terrae TaxID=2530383 RepID=UPI001FE61CBD|nr:SDR family NAD(P)-dependent oxidoreductase [Nonomuraea terrae]